jgi:hypothetical protein
MKMSVKYNSAAYPGSIFAEKKHENNNLICVHQYCQRAAVCKHLYFFG